MPSTQTHLNLKKNLDMLMLDDMSPALHQSSHLLTQSNSASLNYATLAAQQHHNTHQQLARLTSN